MKHIREPMTQEDIVEMMKRVSCEELPGIDVVFHANRESGRCSLKAAAPNALPNTGHEVPVRIVDAFEDLGRTGVERALRDGMRELAEKLGVEARIDALEPTLASYDSNVITHEDGSMWVRADLTSNEIIVKLCQIVAAQNEELIQVMKRRAECVRLLEEKREEVYRLKGARSKEGAGDVG